MHQLIIELQSRITLYETWLSGELLSPQTRRAYISRIKRFRQFLQNCQEPEQADKTKALRCLAQKFHDHLVHEAKAKPSSVNASITAVYHYYNYLGHTVKPVMRDWVLKNEPRVLTPEEKDRLILSVASSRTTVRDRALITLLLFTGIRIGECRDLRLGDVEISAHTGRIKVSSRSRIRTIPLNQAARQSLLQWLIERAKKFESAEDEEPLFPNKAGKFMTRAAIDEVVRKTGRAANLNICAQILRNTFLTSLLEHGTTLELVAELGGQVKLEHVRRFVRDTVVAEPPGAFLDQTWDLRQDSFLSQQDSKRIKEP